MCVEAKDRMKMVLAMNECLLCAIVMNYAITESALYRHFYSHIIDIRYPESVFCINNLLDTSQKQVSLRSVIEIIKLLL